jgi:hypothetical protein
MLVPVHKLEAKKLRLIFFSAGLTPGDEPEGEYLQTAEGQKVINRDASYVPCQRKLRKLETHEYFLILDFHKTLEISKSSFLFKSLLGDIIPTEIFLIRLMHFFTTCELSVQVDKNIFTVKIFISRFNIKNAQTYLLHNQHILILHIVRVSVYGAKYYSLLRI